MGQYVGSHQAEIDRLASQLAGDPIATVSTFPAPVELSAAERIAEHTGLAGWVKTERIAAFMAERGKPLTSGEQALIASVIDGR
jgi:hypothetical protein